MGKGSLIMAIRRDNQKFQLSLAGDFDGTSACELLNLTKPPKERKRRNQ